MRYTKRESEQRKTKGFTKTQYNKVAKERRLTESMIKRILGPFERELQSVIKSLNATLVVDESGNVMLHCKRRKTINKEKFTIEFDVPLDRLFSTDLNSQDGLVSQNIKYE